MADVRSDEYYYEKVPTVEFGQNDSKIIEKSTYGYGVRHVQCFIFFLSLLVGYMSRAHLGVSIVAMTYNPKIVHNPTDDTTNINDHVIMNKHIDEANNITNQEDNTNNNTINGQENNISLEETEMNTLTLNDNRTTDVSSEKLRLAKAEWINNTIEQENVTSDENGVFKKYVWSKPIQEMVLTSFFLGYCVMQYMMSLIAQRYGGKLPLQIGLLVSGFVSIATPWLAFWGGWKAVCVCRILQGASQGGFYPSIQTLLAQWVPPNERAMLASCIYTASIISTIVAFQLGGVLAASSLGWPSIFWGAGTLCFLAYGILTISGAATPAEHKTITDEEVKYITFTMTNVNKKKPRMPIKAVLSSKHVWAAFATHTGSMVAFLFTFMQVPSYIHYSLGVNVKNSGLLSSLPYVVSFFTSILYGAFSDYLTNRKIVSVKTARRLFNTISQVGMAVCLIAVPHTKSVSLAIALLVLAQSSSVGFHVGWTINYIDLSSNFSGALLAMGNTINNMFTLTLPVLVSFIVTDVTNQTQGRVMFYLMAILTLVTNAIFVVFISAERQPWDDVKPEKADDSILVEKYVMVQKSPPSGRTIEEKNNGQVSD